MHGAHSGSSGHNAIHLSEDLRHYGSRIEALVRKYAPWPCATAWVDLDDYRSEAWEAACRVRERYRVLTATDLENVTVAAIRNALINLRRKVAISGERTPALPRRTMSSVSDREDRHEALIAAIFTKQVAATLRPPVRRLFDAIVSAHLTTTPLAATTLARRIGTCAETVRAHREELKRVVMRALIS